MYMFSYFSTPVCIISSQGQFMSSSLQFITNYTRNRDEIITKADGGRTFFLLYLYFGVKLTKFPMGGEELKDNNNEYDSRTD